MKIALFIADFGGGGAERVFVNLANGFSVRGHTVDLVIGNGRKVTYFESISSSVRVVDLKVDRMLKSLPRLTRYLYDNKPDVVLATRVHSCCFAVLAKILIRSRTAVVLREANTLSFDLNKNSWFRKIILKLSIKTLYPFADAIIGVSQGVVDDLCRVVSGVKKRLYLVYSPIITEDIYEKAAEPLDHPWFNDSTIPVFLSVGRLSEQKKFDDLIKAFSILRRKKDVRLLILGEGALRGKLEFLIDQLSLKDDIQLLGFDPNPFRFMSRARLFVLSSAWEGLPGALIQALACGCPVISTDCPSGPREILKDGRLGKLVPVGDVNALAMAMEEALAQKPIGVGEEDISQYTMEKAVGHYLRVFDIARKA